MQACCVTAIRDRRAAKLLRLIKDTLVLVRLLVATGVSYGLNNVPIEYRAVREVVIFGLSRPFLKVLVVDRTRWRPPLPAPGWSF